MLEYLFGSQILEKILFFLLKNERCYASQLKTVFDQPLFSFQRALARLEKGGVLISKREGKNLIYEINPRYPFLEELVNLLKKGYDFLPQVIKEKYYEPLIRKRPRRSGKPL